MKKTRKSGVYAIKEGMTSIYIDNVMTAVTVVRLLPMNILKKEQNYALVCVNGGSKLKYPQHCMLKKFNINTNRGFICEVGLSNKSKLDNNSNIIGPEYFTGAQKFDSNIKYLTNTISTGLCYLKTGDYVDVSAKTRGHGFQGVIKRHGFKGGRASHGASLSHRIHGATGSRQDPGKVMKGKKMAGHMGCEMRTMQNLKIVEILASDNVLLIKGSVPGPKRSVVFISEAIKK